MFNYIHCIHFVEICVINIGNVCWRNCRGLQRVYIILRAAPKYSRNSRRKNALILSYPRSLSLVISATPVVIWIAAKIRTSRRREDGGRTKEGGEGRWLLKRPRSSPWVLRYAEHNARFPSETILIRMRVGGIRDARARWYGTGPARRGRSTSWLQNFLPNYITLLPFTKSRRGPRRLTTN